MSHYTLKMSLACFGGLLFALTSPYVPKLSQSAVYTILICLMVACFVIGKIWPNLFTSNGESPLLTSENNESQNKKEAAPLKYKIFAAFSCVYVSILLIISFVKN